MACGNFHCDTACLALCALVRGALVWRQALMLAAAADSAAACEALLRGQATLELADALGRTALMFATGNDACAALRILLDAGASVGAPGKRLPNYAMFLSGLSIAGFQSTFALLEHK